MGTPQDMFRPGSRWLLFLRRPMRLNTSQGVASLRGTAVTFPDEHEEAFDWQHAYDFPIVKEAGAKDWTMACREITPTSQGAIDAIIEQVRVRRDASAPTVSVTAPTAGAWVKSAVAVGVAARDDNGIASLQLVVDGAAVGDSIPNPAHGPAWDTSLLWDSATVPDGRHELAALARDVADNRAVSAPAAITVDNTSPRLSVTVTPARIWPPNQRFVAVTAAITVAEQDPASVVRLVSITCDGGCDPSGDIRGASYGTDDREFELRAEREGKSRLGRTYTIKYSATDKAGNATSAQALVVVPHDQGGGAR